jgi:PKD repeat protein
VVIQLLPSLLCSVNPFPNFTANKFIGCSPLSVAFTNLSTGSNSVSWNFDDGSALSTQSNPLHTFTNTSSSSAAVYDVQLIAKNSHSCRDTISQSVTVSPLVAASFSPDTLVCGPDSAYFVNTTIGADTYSWTFGDGGTSASADPVHFYANAGNTALNYTVTLIANNSVTGCTNTKTNPIKIYPTPKPTFNATPSSQTFPSATVATNNTTSGLMLWTYQWSFGDGGISLANQPANHTYATYGTYTITLIASSAKCSDTITKQITILPPKPVATFTGSFTGCKPVTATFTNNSLYATSYEWNFGDGGTSILPTPSHDYTVAGTYSVTLIATGVGGVDTVKLNNIIKVLEKPAANFSATPVDLSIPDGKVTFTNSTVNGTTYVWDFGDGDTSHAVNPEHIYTDGGDFTVNLYAKNSSGCRDTFTFSSIHIEVISGIEVPNAFSPGMLGPSDGIFDPTSLDNNIFHPVLRGVTTYQFRIYNRWGEVVFYTENIAQGWDGYYKGKLCEQDIYIWKIDAATSDEKTIKKSGDVLLIR